MNDNPWILGSMIIGGVVAGVSALYGSVLELRVKRLKTILKAIDPRILKKKKSE